MLRRETELNVVKEPWWTTAGTPKRALSRGCGDVFGEKGGKKWAAADLFGRKLEENVYLCSVSSRSFMYLLVFSFRWLSGDRQRK